VSEPSAEPPTLTTLTPGSVVGGRYRIERPLGEGAMGAVYLAEHVHMRKQVALKVLLSEARENKEIVARFEREAIAAAHIDHPNVVSASDFGTTEDGLFFLVLELVKGDSLRDVVEAGPLPLDRVVAIATQMGAALTKAHGMGIVHRDLKPENVMLVPREGEPELVKVRRAPRSRPRAPSSGPPSTCRPSRR
jgi:serine/threonine-protein kinase